MMLVHAKSNELVLSWHGTYPSSTKRRDISPHFIKSLRFSFYGMISYKLVVTKIFFTLQGNRKSKLVEHPISNIMYTIYGSSAVGRTLKELVKNWFRPSNFFSFYRSKIPTVKIQSKQRMKPSEVNRSYRTTTIIYKIFERNSSFIVKQRAKVKVQFSFLEEDGER